MLKKVFMCFVALLAIAAAAAGPVRGQNANPDVTLDFTTNSWGLPTTGNNQGPDSYFNGTYSITLYADNAYRLNSGYLYLGQSGSYLELPEFSSPVEKIEVVGRSGASMNVKQNIYVGATAVSTQTTGATGTNTYVIAENYRAAGNIYTLRVESFHNTQITYIKVYYVSSGGGSTPAVPHTVRFAAGNDGWTVTDVDSATSATAPAVLQNVMAGDSLVVTAPATLPGKVKSVKAVKYVAPAATVTTAPTATAGIIEAGSTTALVNAGAASGGTMMYAVTTTNAQPTDGFSATRPTAEGRAAGTYYVWYYVKADADHSDSEIAGPVSVTVTPAPITITWNSSNISDLSVSGTYDSYTKEGITLSANADMIDAMWMNYGDESRRGISFNTHASDGFTFTAPSGKKFTKIEMTLTGQGGWDFASLGTGWSYSENPMTAIYKATWTGSAASTVGLLTGANDFGGENVKSIVFTLIDAQ